MRFLIFGAGFIGPINTKALMECEGVTIAGVCNRTSSKAEAMCEKLGLTCPVYTDWKQALDEVKPDAAVICVFNDQHKEYLLECARRGIHVLVEKPMANTFADCQEMMDAARAGGIRVSVLQTQRYGAVLQTAKKYQREHASELGKLCHVTDEISCHYFWEGRSPWHLDDKRSGGGAVLNYGVHQLDRVHWLMEQPAEEACMHGTETIYVHDTNEFYGNNTVEFHAHYLREKPGIETVSSYTMMGKTAGGTSYVITMAGYSGPPVNELKLYYQNRTMLLRLVSNGAGERGVYVGDTASGVFSSVPLCCEDGQDAHEMYVREMQEAVDYLAGRTDVPPVSMQWAAQMVRLCCLGFDK